MQPIRLRRARPGDPAILPVGTARRAGTTLLILAIGAIVLLSAPRADAAGCPMQTNNSDTPKKVSELLGTIAANGTQVTRWVCGHWVVHTFFFGQWVPDDQIGPGESFFVGDRTDACASSSSPFLVKCPQDKPVPAGGSWDFDEPTVSSINPGCPNGTVPRPTVVSTIANEESCPHTVTRTWEVKDGVTHTTTCSQTVTLVDDGKFITVGPVSQTVHAGETISFTVSIRQGQLKYRWFFNGTQLVNDGHTSGADTQILFIADARISDSGNYHVIVTDNCHSDLSQDATLTVQPGGELLKVTIDQAGQLIGGGQTAGNVFFTGPVAKDTDVSLSFDTVWPLTGVPPPKVASGPATLKFTTGAAVASFPITTALVPHVTAVDVRARHEITKMARLIVYPAPIPVYGPEADARVRGLLDLYIGAAKGDLKQAYDNILVLRNTDVAVSQDAYLAAAEHYLEARLYIAAHPRLVVFTTIGEASVVLGYEIAKLLVDVRTSEKPATPFSPLSLKWGADGVVDGITDIFGKDAVFKTPTPTPAPPVLTPQGFSIQNDLGIQGPLPLHLNFAEVIAPGVTLAALAPFVPHGPEGYAGILLFPSGPAAASTSTSTAGRSAVPTDAGEPPSKSRLGAYFRLSTTATTTGDLGITVDHSTARLTAVQSALVTLRQFDEESGQWKNITVRRDLLAQTVTGTASTGTGTFGLFLPVHAYEVAIQSIGRVGASGVRLLATGAPWIAYDRESSDDLAHWNPAGQATADDSGRLEFLAPLNGSAASEFFRLRLP